MINKNTAIKLMIGLLSIVIVFHLCVLFEFISYDKVWAGRINSIEEMRVFETISILINIFLIITLFFKSKNIQKGESNRVVDMILWVFVFLFVINTIGNLFATNILERTLGTALTLVCSILCWIIVKKDKIE